MKWLFRPSLLIVLSAALVAGAAAVFFRGGPVQTRPQPLPVAAGDHEVVWLYAATNPGAWERFVEAVSRSAERLREDQPGLAAEGTAAAFPQHTTAVPEVALRWPGAQGRLVFRWYKLTSDWNTRDWVDALLKRQPPPLAVIGGSSSDGARELADQLNKLSAALPADRRPLLLLTTATADRVPPPEGIGPPPDPVGQASRLPAVGQASRLPAPEEPEETPGIVLHRIYPGRTFRFCFTNRQMATAVVNFIWTRDDLRPDTDPLYRVQWADDSYSRDLIEGFWKALHEVVARSAVESAARQWAWATGCAAAAGPPPGFGGVLPADHLGRAAGRFSMSIPPTPYLIDSSVGSFATPNRYEEKVAHFLVDELLDLHRPQRRPLLLVTGQSQPSRRFLRAVARMSPAAARRFVVATGDAIAFNTIYRDRRVAWPVQDLPFALVLFCHHNPVDREAGFRPATDPHAPGGPALGGPPADTATGTEDILLYGDIVEALAQSFRPPGPQADRDAGEGGPAADATELGRRLAAARLRDNRIGFDPDGVPLFRPDGKRQSGTGEHVVCLRPWFARPVVKKRREDDPWVETRNLPRATIEVWGWRPVPEGGHSWQRSGEPLDVSYVEFAAEGGGRDPHR